MPTTNIEKTIVLDVSPDTHAFLTYVATVRGTSMRKEGEIAIVKGLEALAADPLWIETVHEHEMKRAAALGRFGVPSPKKDDGGGLPL